MMEGASDHIDELVGAALAEQGLSQTQIPDLNDNVFSNNSEFEDTEEGRGWSLMSASIGTVGSFLGRIFDDFGVKSRCSSFWRTIQSMSEEELYLWGDRLFWVFSWCLLVIAVFSMLSWLVDELLTDTPQLHNEIISGVPGAEIPKPQFIKTGAGETELVQLLRERWPRLRGDNGGATNASAAAAAAADAPGCGCYPGPPPFRRTWWLPTGLLQTWWVSRTQHAPQPAVAYTPRLVRLPDGGVLRLDAAEPTSGAAPVGVAVLVPGLTSSSAERYVRGAAAALAAAGWRVLVQNQRGCGNSPIVTDRIYSAAWTADLAHVLDLVRAESGPGLPLALLGFSLGANVSVKYLGERGAATPVDFAVSVGNPWDLVNVSRTLSDFLSGRMVQGLQQIYARGFARFYPPAGGPAAPGAPAAGVSTRDVLAARTVGEFDEAFIRRHHGYPALGDYYRDGSSVAYLRGVRVPLLAVNALDDVICHRAGLPFDESAVNPYVALLTTRGGGHLGWWGPAPSPAAGRGGGGGGPQQRWIEDLLAGFAGAARELCWGPGARLRRPAAAAAPAAPAAMEGEGRAAAPLAAEMAEDSRGDGAEGTAVAVAVAAAAEGPVTEAGGAPAPAAAPAAPRPGQMVGRGASTHNPAASSASWTPAEGRIQRMGSALMKLAPSWWPSKAVTFVVALFLFLTSPTKGQKRRYLAVLAFSGVSLLKSKKERKRNKAANNNFQLQHSPLRAPAA